MAQAVEHKVLNNQIRKVLKAKNEDVAVPQSGNTTLLEVDVSLYDRIWVEVVCAEQALDAFIVQGKFHGDGHYVSLASTAAHYTAPAGVIYGSSGDLTTLAAAATGWIAIDVSGLDAIKILASSGNVAGSVVDIYAGGK